MNVSRTRRSPSSDDPVPPAKQVHQAVLLHDVVEALDVRQNDIVLDATLGGAGHAKALAASLGSEGVFVGFDLDADAIARGERALAGSQATVHLIRADFRDLKTELAKRGVKKLTKALFDLGWSSYQLDSGRGFSISADEPLLMTYSKDQRDVTAATVVNTWQETTLADIIYGFGEERYSRRIAKALVERRMQRPFATARELAECIAQAVPAAYRRGRIHPATRTFQALRIAVNDEFGALDEGIRSAFEMLEPAGRLAVITFHSIEDRAVKRLLAGFVREGKAVHLTRKPLTASDTELSQNRRARSAKLRIIVKAALYDQASAQNKQVQNLGAPGEV